MLLIFDIFEDYGDDDLKTILAHFKDVLADSGIDVAEAEMEWTILKKDILSR